MNPGYDRFQKSSKALKNQESRNQEGLAATGSAVLPSGVTMESCVQEKAIVFCRDPSLIEDAQVGNGIYQMRLLIQHENTLDLKELIRKN